MARSKWIAAKGLCLLLLVGCRVVPGFDLYGNALDDLTDIDVVFDREYDPRWDISRAGQPDWCGPINRTLAPSRCFLGTWQRYDACWLYPPSYPYWYPGDALYRATPSTRRAESSLPSETEPSILNPELLMPSPPAEESPGGLPPAPLPDPSRLPPPRGEAAPNSDPASKVTNPAAASGSWRARTVR
uniref:Uncharacterized protein n=1 Tax=Schlesneria paludicola TaxID=360056 RepID=A0A7C4LJ54_9PLAN